MKALLLLMLLSTAAMAATPVPLVPATMFSSLALLGDPDGPHGSGAFIKPNQIVTAKHVAITLTYGDFAYDWKGRKYVIASVEVSENNDIALVTLKTAANSDVTPVTIDCNLPAVLEPVVALGHPMAMKSIMTTGHINGSTTDREDGFRVIADVTAGPGMSGGPVFDQTGGVFGIVVAVELAPASETDMFNTGFTYILPFNSTPELCKPVLPNEGKPS